ncbi:transmembrane protein 174 [Osmerus mordax]|uniref:transmembrane protein 174 n=1 Tax=Osmerus mordax TaxID=8014 RepID=UPI00350F4A56
MLGQQSLADPALSTVAYGVDTGRSVDVISPGGVPLTIATILPGPLAAGLDASGGAASDSEKTGATLLFSGIFMTLVGMTFTAMGWLNLDHNHSQGWSQLMGPILLSVGGSFVFISICKFRLITCGGCSEQPDEDTDATVEQIAPGQSFLFNSINQPIVFQGAAVMQYIPPPYASVTQDASPANAVALNLPPRYYTVCPAENQGFNADDDITLSATTGSRSREERLDNGKDSDDDCTSTRLPPPSYEDIYPSVPTDHM